MSGLDGGAVRCTLAPLMAGRPRCRTLALALAAAACPLACGDDDVDAAEVAQRDVPSYEGGVIRFSPAWAETSGLKSGVVATEEIQPVVDVTGTLS